MEWGYLLLIVNQLSLTAEGNWEIYLLESNFQLFSKYSIAFIIYFISFPARVVPEPVICSVLRVSIPLSRKIFPKSLAKSISLLATLDKIFPEIGVSRWTPPKCTIQDNYFFENLKLADKQLAKGVRIFETCISVNNSLCGKLVSSL